MRRILHLLALLALILAGSVPGLRLEAAAEPAHACCCGAGCGCGMPSKGPSPSPCRTQVIVALAASPAMSPSEQTCQADSRREPAPWPTDLAATPLARLAEASPIRGPCDIEPSPPDRQAQLSVFRI